jgi:hypothetical protein
MSSSAATPSTVFTAALDAALARCRKLHGDRVDCLIADPASLEDVLNVAQAELAKTQKVDSRRARVINAIITFAKLVDSYAKALDIYVNKSPEVASLVWGSCRVILKVCS